MPVLTVKVRRSIAAIAGLAVTASLAACGSDEGGAEGSSDDGVAVSLITKESTNPFFVAMQEGAKAEAAKEGIDLTVGAGSEDGDEQGQVQLIENAIAAGQQGIIITPNGPGVNSAIEKARDAGLYVIALDTPPDPAETVDITFATDNFKAGQLIGQWTKAQLAGEPATIALLDAFDDKAVSVDYERDQGFLDGMGIDTVDPMVNGDEAPTGDYDGGTYTIVCNEATQAAEDGGRTGMENCLTRNPDINVVYTINEPTATGAYNALEAADKTDVLVVSIDGGCAGVQSVTDGIIGATSQQYPLKMAELGVKAIAAYANDGTEPSTSPGLDFFDTGVTLVTDQPADGVESIDSAEGADVCWG